MTKLKFLNETELAQAVAAYVRDAGWDTHYEVAPWDNAGARADIVATKGRLLWIIETKLTLSIALIEQAMKWETYAHYVSIATPVRAGIFVSRVCHREGIGTIYAEVLDRRWAGPGPGSGPERTYKISEWLGAARLNRHATQVETMRRVLSDEHRTYAQPGSADGSYWTRYKQTCADILKIVEARPGLTIKQLLDDEELEHHYSSTATAKSTIAAMVQKGAIPGVRCKYERIGNRTLLTLWPEGHEGLALPPMQASLRAETATS